MQDFDDIIEQLEKIASPLDPENIHWIPGEAGENWCYACGKAKAKHMRRRAKKNKKDFILDGGWSGGEEDNPAYCEGCGKLLHYSLTDYGVEQELSHFLNSILVAPLNPETAYELCEVFGNGRHVKRDGVSSGLLVLANKVIGVLSNSFAAHKSENLRHKGV